MKTILLTGATGFIGSHIAETLSNAGYKLLLTKRTSSDLWRCASFIEKAKWTNIDDDDSFEKDVCNFTPEVIINCAWDGVSAKNRNIWFIQINNLLLQQRLLELAEKTGVKKIIGIGSQAEYGNFNGKIDENYPTNPDSSYGAAKLAAYIILKAFCEENNLKWYWFRVFSCFGERESENWLIPTTIKNILSNTEMDLTQGEQQYSYLYIKDLATLISNAVESNADSGIYNIASDNLRSLKSILLKIKDYINPDFKMNFGAIPYRKNQSMINGSINTKAQQAFGQFETSNFDDVLKQTIEFYKKFYNEKR